MMLMRKICIVTATRAEYGQLSRLIKLAAEDHSCELQLLVTGTHLSKDFGYTCDEIENDGFKITEKIDIKLSSDSPYDISLSMGTAISSFTSAFIKLKPDIVVLLGDRYEIFAVATAAMLCQIPIAHLGGGAVTEGAIDEAIRHSVTKMAHLHFAGAELEKKRIIQLGETPWRVFNFGEPAVDVIKNTPLLSKDKLEAFMGRKFQKHNLLITYHPVTLAGRGDSVRQFDKLLEVLDKLKDTLLIFTKPNADADCRSIAEKIDSYVKSNHEKAIAFFSMGRVNYLSAMQFVDAVVGNSSSGLAEAPTFKIATINIGSRQTGRIKASSVIDCAPEKKQISEAFKKLYSDEFRKSLKNTVNPYGEGGASEKIYQVIKTFPLENILKKQFRDLNLD